MKPIHVRERLVQALQADLIGPFTTEEGPAGSEEILPVAPSRWYLAGFLAPQEGNTPDAEDADSVNDVLAAGSESQAEDAGAEERPAKRRMRFPASMGLSVFLPPGEGDALEVAVRYADYEKIELAEETTDKRVLGWRRMPRGPIPISIPLQAAQLAEGIPVPDSEGLMLRGELRETSMAGLPPGTRVLSLFLVNERAPAKQDRDQRFIFQVELELHFQAGFVPRPNRRGEESHDSDLAVFALNFRKKMEWAVGHNVSVAEPELEDGKVRSLRTTHLPRYEVRPVEHRDFDGVTLGMAALAKLDGKGLENALSPLVEAYGQWTDEQRDIPLDRESLIATRGDLVSKASRAKQRIATGITLLREDPQALRAFQLTNQAMHVAAMQLDRTRADRRYKGEAVPKWRPFQIAFLLMNLPGIVDPKHDDRKLAELIYFPTGGGKTEAYLGLAAFVLLLRRMRGQGEAHEGRGVAVLLRYTLRLLTLDQLGRAATLVCTLEQIRSLHPDLLGNERFSIGLWVGSSTTPNRMADLSRVLSDPNEWRAQAHFPLPNCPWCGEEIGSNNIKLLDEAGRPSRAKAVRAAVYCANHACQFSERNASGRGLPVSFVDEQIYREVPAFLVATVDKFAMVPWRGDAGMLFGQATHVDDKRAYGVMDAPPVGARPLPEGLLPPELIIQDELHLISGPLGTMVGLYEAAVDYLCERPGQETPKPKVICSTATVRRAREQIQAIFGRKMSLFPPRGVDEGDNFFAYTDHDKPGRLYVGAGAPGRALRAVSVRSYAAVLAAAQKHFDPDGAEDQAADPYMTLIGYFNSLRELGGMRRLVEDEVASRVKEVEKKRPRQVIGPHPWAADRRLRLPAELTSRESTERVKETKARLAARRASKGEPLDVVLASNMIAVGLDVDRLGLMVVTGQPKTSSEYIQATSRIGRAYPGLVVTCLNVARPRDRSHYERFVAYHESFYREVEATSVTPFSGQALDRGLVGTLLTMIRHGDRELQPPLGAMEIHERRTSAEAALAWLVERAKGHRYFPDKAAEDRIADLIRARGRSFLDAWVRIVTMAVEGGGARTYSKNDRAGSQGLPLLFTATDEPPVVRDERWFQLPTSMRDVEESVHVWLRYKQLDERDL